MYKRDYFNYTLGRLESHIVLDVILDFLNTNYPELFASQIYDNVISTVSDSDIVSKVMDEKLTGFIGVPPSLKVENFDRPQKNRVFNSFKSKNTEERKKEGRKGKGNRYSHTMLKVLQGKEYQLTIWGTLI